MINKFSFLRKNFFLNGILKLSFLFLIMSANFEDAISKENYSKNIIDRNKIKDNFDIYDEDISQFENSFQIDAINDPYEKINRKIYKFNDNVDRFFLEPIARSYRFVFPKFIRKSVTNFTNNISSPFSAINSFAQGKLDNGLATLSSFVINSTIGIFGFIDVAGAKKIYYNKEDFGQTLAHFNVPSGGFLMLPFIGPSTSRDFGGMLLDNSIDVFGFNLLKIGGDKNFIENDYRIANTLVSVIVTREGLIDVIDGVRKDSFDPYSTIRSAYIQRRQMQIRN